MEFNSIPFEPFAIDILMESMIRKTNREYIKLSDYELNTLTNFKLDNKTLYFRLLINEFDEKGIPIIIRDNTIQPLKGFKKVIKF